MDNIANPMLLNKSILLLAVSLLAGSDVSIRIQQQARDQNKNVAVYFSGSDWCAVCYKFKSSVLDNRKVDSLLKEKYVFYLADFPQRKKLHDSIRTVNEALADKLNADGIFPKLVLADEELHIKSVITGADNCASAFEKLKQHQK